MLSPFRKALSKVFWSQNLNHERETVQKKKEVATGQKRPALSNPVVPEGNLWSGMVAHENCFSGNYRKWLVKEEMKMTP